ncbi:MgtC/SapB family protein [Microcoleus sp. FACHB-1515]|uniref:MgtC/SapB family protein n=1 Tax=Leptolyngbya sp. FACHB-1515 TaxID=2933931 RepID=UPI00168A34C9|nr:MgtC/SapB family protein [Microcoleus sp. FACHB-1515]
MFFSPNDWQMLVFRLSMALLAGGAIGLNRQRSNRPAGVRTYMTVSVGAAMFVMIPLQTSIDINSINALSRTVQGIATGVGFIGAGLILQQSRQNLKPQVKGLTSAAALWLTAGLGTAAGCGLWRMSLIGTVLMLFILSGVKELKRAPIYRYHLYGKRSKKARSIHTSSSTSSSTDESD